MRRIHYMAYICLVLSLIACSSSTSSSKSGITVKGADGTEYESYQECCAALDFQAAHQYLAKLQNTENPKEDLSIAKDFVFKQEALYLMSQGDETAKKRILYLLKEEGDNDARVDMLIDLAITNDDKDFVKTLANQISSSAYLFKAVHYLIYKGSPEDIQFVIKLIEKTGLSLSNKELIAELASLNIKEFSDVIINLIAKKEIKGRKVPKGMLRRYEFETGNHEYNSEYGNYVSCINDYNKTCDQVLDIAINKGNDYIAKKILIMYKEDVFTILGGDYVKAPNGKDVDFYNCFVYYTNDSKNNAQKRYREAKMNGAFK